MAIFVDSWPAGIAVALLTLPVIGTGYGVAAVHLAVAASAGVGMLLIAALYKAPVILTVVALGLISGQPAGPIMSLPARVLQPQTRAIGMGLFFTMFYGCMMLGPVVGGACAKWAGSAAAAFDFGAVMILLCPLVLWAFNRIPAAMPKAA